MHPRDEHFCPWLLRSYNIPACISYLLAQCHAVLATRRNRSLTWVLLLTLTFVSGPPRPNKVDGNRSRRPALNIPIGLLPIGGPRCDGGKLTAPSPACCMYDCLILRSIQCGTCSRGGCRRSYNSPDSITLHYLNFFLFIFLRCFAYYHSLPIVSCICVRLIETFLFELFSAGEKGPTYASRTLSMRIPSKHNDIQ
jgi:hypothetical protein